MKVILNGSDQHFDVARLSVAAMLRSLGFENKKIAVELNLEIVSKSSYEETFLENGDRVEIVQFVGGG